jgi:hypothetical protein
MDYYAIDMALHVQRFEMVNRVMWFLEHHILHCKVKHYGR